MTTDADRMTQSEIRERLTYIGFTDADAELLRSLKPWMQGAVKDFVTRFYDPQFQQTEFVEVLTRNKSSRGVLEQAQVGYCMDLFDGYPNEAYTAKRRMIGRRHSILGVPHAGSPPPTSSTMTCCSPWSRSSSRSSAARASRPPTPS